MNKNPTIAQCLKALDNLDNIMALKSYKDRTKAIKIYEEKEQNVIKQHDDYQRMMWEIAKQNKKASKSSLGDTPLGMA